MRWDVRVDDWRAVRDKRLFFDGVDITNSVRAFDTEQGWVERLVLTEDGNAQRDPNDYNELLVETLHGTVTLK